MQAWDPVAVCVEDRSVPAGGFAVPMADTHCLVQSSHPEGRLVPCLVLQRREEESIPQSTWDFLLGAARSCWLERGHKMKMLPEV